MAYATAQNAAAAHTGLLGRIGAFIEARRAAMAKRKTYRATLRELAALTDRELADLGIARCQIRGVAYHASYGV